MDIFQAHHFYAPFFLIKLDGEPADGPVQRDVLQVIYRDDLKGIDTFAITLNNWDAKTTGQSMAKYIGPGRPKDSTLFEPGRRVEVFMGYYPANVPDPKPMLQRRMLMGEITSLAVNLPASGQPTLRVSGQNVLRRFITKQETQDYADEEALTDTQIAREAFNRGNLSARGVDGVELRTLTDPDREAPRRDVKQDNQYPIVFMMALARHSGYDLWLEEPRTNGRTQSLLFFGTPTREPGPTGFRLEWGKSLIQFQPTLTIVRQVSSVTVRGWNPDTRGAIIGTARLSDLLVRVQRDAGLQGRLEESFAHREETVVDRPIRDRAEAVQLAKAKLEELVRQTVTCSGTTLGHPDLRAGTEVELAGLGPTFSGNYVLTGTTHTIGSNGYQTEFHAGKEERR